LASVRLSNHDMNGLLVSAIKDTPDARAGRWLSLRP
jgi:hypothetical protein